MLHWPVLVCRRIDYPLPRWHDHNQWRESRIGGRGAHLPILLLLPLFFLFLFFLLPLFLLLFFIHDHKLLEGLRRSSMGFPAIGGWSPTRATAGVALDHNLLKQLGEAHLWLPLPLQSIHPPCVYIFLMPLPRHPFSSRITAPPAPVDDDARKAASVFTFCTNMIFLNFNPFKTKILKITPHQLNF
jgi:hypothetical protein